MWARAVDVPILRRDVIGYIESYGVGVYLDAIRTGTQSFIPPGLNDRSAAEYLARAEAQRVRNAELFHVTEAMTDLARVAAYSFPECGLMPEDLPSPSGFVVFASPLVWVELSTPSFVKSASPTTEFPVLAASWSHWDVFKECGHDVAGPELGGVWVTWYTAPNDRRPNSDYRWPNRLVIDNEGYLPFRPDPVPNATATENCLTVALLALWSIWTLMNSPITATEAATFDRSSTRRTVRELGTIPEVRVIQLRRRKGDIERADQDGSREYQHQWVVRGHWRQQWYPAREVHRPIWIAPHVKGPEGAPLIGGERVYTLKR